MLSRIKYQFCVLLFIKSIVCNAQGNPDIKFDQSDSIKFKIIAEIQKGRDSIGILIKKEDFDSIFLYYSSYVKTINKNKLSINDCIEITKLYNTIGFNSLGLIDSSYSKFVHFVDEYLYIEIFKKLEAQLSIGGGLYSKKYNVYIGGIRDKNSIYRFIK